MVDVVHHRGEVAGLEKAQDAAAALYRNVTEAVYAAAIHPSGDGAARPGGAPRIAPGMATDVATFIEAARGADIAIAASQVKALQRDVMAIATLADEIIAGPPQIDTLRPRLRMLAVLAETRGLPVVTALRGQIAQSWDASSRWMERRLVLAGLIALGLLLYLHSGVLMPLRHRLGERETALARAGADAKAHEADVLSAMAHAAHDIRTTMNGVTGMAGLLRRTSLDAEQARYVTLMGHSSAALLRLVNEVMDLAKVASGEMALTTAPYDPAKLIVHTVTPFAPELHRRGIRLLIDVDPALPRESLGDETRLRQVLSNLVHNAVKFTESGHVIVEARWMADLALMEVIVSDTGPGVAPEQRDRIFGAYKQVGNGLARGEGTGLGLALARRIVDRLGGDIGVRTAPGGGAAFWFRVPLSAPVAGEADLRDMLQGMPVCLAVDWPPLAAMLSRQLSARGAVIVSARRAAALIIERAAVSDLGPALALTPAESGADPVTLHEPVDPDQLCAAVTEAVRPAPRPAFAVTDDVQAVPAKGAPLALSADDSEINRLVTAALLADAGWRVETVQDGAEAVEAAGRLLPALILLDLSMPKLDGLAAARAIRALPLPAGAGRPVILAATGRDDAGTAEAVTLAGMDGVLVKPLTAAGLAEALKRVTTPLQRAG